MHHTLMVLVCHATDGYFADGDREAVRRVLEWSDSIAQIDELGHERYTITCADQGQLELSAPGLYGSRSFHRMELSTRTSQWTSDMFNLLFDLMRAGGFGLMDDLCASRLIVTLPQQVSYFPWLPEPPLLVRNAHELGHTISQPVL